MKIVLLQSIAGHAVPLYGLPEFAFRPGEIVEIDDTLARAWIASGVAQKAKKNATPSALFDPEGKG